MTKRKATCEHGQLPDFCSKCAHTALVERVIEACAKAAAWEVTGEFTEKSIRAAVIAAGRRAAKGETT